MRTSWILLALALCACGGGGGGGGGDGGSGGNPPPDPTATCETAELSFDVVTWNTALGPGMVSLATPRAAPVAEAVSSLQFEVLCLQEVWSDDARDNVVAALGLPAENVFYSDTTGQGEDGTDKCTAAEVAPVEECAATECADLTDEEVTPCVQSKCVKALAPIAFNNRRCLNCLVATAGLNVSDAVGICTSTGKSRIQDGNNGLVLASRWPLTNTEIVLVPATSANRAGLFATVQVPGMEAPIDVVCTHLASPDSLPPFHSGFKTWSEEQVAEANALTDKLSARAGERPALLIGDFNSGPAFGSEVVEENIAAWNAMQASKLVPTADEAFPGCTICGDNTFRLGGSNKWIDHALVRRGMKEAMKVGCSTKLFETPVDLTGYRDEAVTTNLSDHYGVRYTVVVR